MKMIDERPAKRTKIENMLRNDNEFLYEGSLYTTLEVRRGGGIASKMACLKLGEDRFENHNRIIELPMNTAVEIVSVECTIIK